MTFLVPGIQKSKFQFSFTRVTGMILWENVRASEQTHTDILIPAIIEKTIVRGTSIRYDIKPWHARSKCHTRTCEDEVLNYFSISGHLLRKVF